MARRRVCIVVLPQVMDRAKQLANTLEWAALHKCVLTSVTEDLHAARALALDHLVEVVLTAVDTPAVLDLELQLQGSDVEVQVVRRIYRRSAISTKILDAAGRGVDSVSIALVLNVDLAQVIATLEGHHTGPPSPDRRPMRLMPEDQPEHEPQRRPQRRGHLPLGA